MEKKLFESKSINRGYTHYNSLQYKNQVTFSTTLTCLVLLIKKGLSDRSYTRGMIHNKIHLISQGCPRPQKCRIKAYNTIYSFLIKKIIAKSSTEYHENQTYFFVHISRYNSCIRPHYIITMRSLRKSRYPSFIKIRPYIHH